MSFWCHMNLVSLLINYQGIGMTKRESVRFITIEQALKLVETRTKSLDTDNDGLITKEEFEKARYDRATVDSLLQGRDKVSVEETIQGFSKVVEDKFLKSSTA